MAISEKQMEMIQEIAENISYGTVTLVFQDGVLVQIDRNEKIRLPREPKRTNH
ncbi:MAG: YezD family protein [Eubacteriales bacterium]|nr:YezD family protein [Eubacteriales bacterium]